MRTNTAINATSYQRWGRGDAGDVVDAHPVRAKGRTRHQANALRPAGLRGSNLWRNRVSHLSCDRDRLERHLGFLDMLTERPTLLVDHVEEISVWIRQRDEVVPLVSGPVEGSADLQQTLNLLLRLG